MVIVFIIQVGPGTPELGGAAAPLAFCWEGQGGAKVPFKYKKYYNSNSASFQDAFS